MSLMFLLMNSMTTMICNIEGFKTVSRKEYNSVLKQFRFSLLNTRVEWRAQEISDYHDMEYFYTYDSNDNCIAIMINDRTRKSISEMWKAKTTYYLANSL